LGGHLSLSFCIQFFKQRVSIALQCALTFAIERKIMLVGDACSRPPITIKFHDLHAGDIRGAMGEIISYHEKDLFFPFYWFLQVVHPLAVLWPSFFVSFVMVLAINLLLDFCGKFLTTTCLRYLKIVCHFHFLIVCVFHLFTFVIFF
jgi:hypothetical protein